jgi:EpsI family protein
MKSVFVRIAIVIGLVVVVHLGGQWLSGGLRPTGEMPDWNLEDLPRQLGDWTGEDKELDREVFARIGADVVVDRVYQNPRGQSLSMHVAIFKDQTEGLLHSPTNCYRGTGWQQRIGSEKKVTLKTPNRPDAPVQAAVWERNADTCFVLYWFEMGDSVLYERVDLAKVQWDLRGQKSPALIKVLLQCANSDTADAQLLEFAGQVRQWLGHTAGGQASGR